MDAAQERGRIVVGVDGSLAAEDALRYAVTEARRRGLAVRAVVAYEPPDAWMSSYGVPLLADSDEIRQSVEDAMRTRVEAVLRELAADDRAVPLEVVAVTGPAAWVLEQEATGAELLVVGHRGRGALRSRLLGSVGLSVVLRAPCPVTVVPTPQRVEEPTADEAAIVAGPLPVGPIA
ncbi:universal stress protein [Actinomycetospora lutea]|uniref:universal stress protein n=1 Tax=Actinomycetospora lutea TaxID=663604 RepID=UPI002365896C|nr:universal stress protein [Actinomycetospora lutea]MDD7939615.1 universal stress protein [Actinomycetospora lutea]